MADKEWLFPTNRLKPAGWWFFGTGAKRERSNLGQKYARALKGLPIWREWSLNPRLRTRYFEGNTTWHISISAHRISVNLDFFGNAYFIGVSSIQHWDRAGFGGASGGGSSISSPRGRRSTTSSSELFFCLSAIFILPSNEQLQQFPRWQCERDSPPGLTSLCWLQEEIRNIIVSKPSVVWKPARLTSGQSIVPDRDLNARGKHHWASLGRINP